MIESTAKQLGDADNAPGIVENCPKCSRVKWTNSYCKSSQCGWEELAEVEEPEKPKYRDGYRGRK